MNNGLKNYTNQLSNVIGNTETHININKTDANMHIIMPLISTVGLCEMNLSLIFSLQNKSEDGLFGKGSKLNMYANFNEAGNTVVMTDSAGAVTQYLSERNNFSIETMLEVKRKTDTSGTYICVKDKNDNEMRYRQHSNYPYQLCYKNGDTVNVNFTSAMKTLNNGKGDEIRLTCESGNRVTKVVYLHNNSEIRTTEITYDSNGYIKTLKYKNGAVVSSIQTYSFSDSMIEILDNNSSYRNAFYLSSGRVTSIKDGYDTTYANSQQTTITYDDKMTTVTNYRGEKTYCYFDDMNLPLYEMDDEGNVLDTNYDKTTKLLVSNSGVMSTSGIGNLFGYTSISSFTKTGVTLTSVQVSNAIFRSILGSSVYRMNGTGTLIKRVNTTGLATDTVTAILFGNDLVGASSTRYVKVTLSLSNGDFCSKKFRKGTSDGLYELMTLGVCATKSYNYIELKIEAVGGTSMEIGGVQVYNKAFGAIYSYDLKGNVTDIVSNGNTSNVAYNGFNQPTGTIGSDSSALDYEYDAYGNPVKIGAAYGATVTNLFDTSYKSNLKKSTISNADGTKLLETSKTYTSDGRFLQTETDELGNTTTYNEYDALGRVKKVTNAIGAVMNVNYNADNTLQRVLLQKGTDSVNSVYQYDARKRLVKVTLSNGSVYDFVYDSYNNIVQIKLNSTVIVMYEYDQISGNILKQKYGTNGDAFSFEYNSKGFVSRVKYVNGSGTVTNKYLYYYNSQDELTKVTDASGNIINEYIYDNNGRVVTVKTPVSRVERGYDNLGNVVSKASKIHEKTVYTSYDSANRSKGSHPESLYAPYKGCDCYLATFEKDGKLRYNAEEVAPIINHTGAGTPTLGRTGVIPYISVGSAKRLSYQLTCRDFYSLPSGCIGFWFKTATATGSNTKKYLISSKNTATNRNDFIGVYLLNKKVYVEVTDKNGTNHSILTSDYEVDLGKWNCVMLNFVNRNDGAGYDDVCEYALAVNSHIQTYKRKNPRIDAYWGDNTVINIGHKYNGSSASNDLDASVTCLLISKKKYVSLREMQKYYRLSKDYLIDNELIDADTKTVDFGQTNLFTVNQSVQDMFEIYPLQSSVCSLKGKKPEKFDARRISSMDKDPVFNFNKISKRYAYVADGDSLVYNFGQSLAGSIAMRCYTDVLETKQYLFEGTDNSNHKLGLYRNNSNKLCIDVNGVTVTTDISMTSYAWHTVAFSFENPTTSESQSTKSLNLRVMVDGAVWTGARTTDFEYGQLKFSIGRKTEGTYTASTFGGYSDVSPFFGQIEMLATRAAYCEQSTINLLIQELTGITRINEVDDFGMLRKTEIHKGGQPVLSNTYVYKTRSDTRYTSHQVRSELIKYGSQIVNRGYTSDSLGNVTAVTDATFGSHNYEYDYRGFLVKEDGVVFQYDANGNVIKKGTVTFGYDSTIKDRLVSVGGTAITYSTANPLNPVTYGSKSYNYEGRRLIKYTSGSIYHNYTYNDRGLRISKKKNDGSTWNYIYDDGKLIYEQGPSGRLDFLYDENGLLYGFIRNNTDKYFYIRDCMQNILAIINENGTIVTKYTYDAWGKITSISGPMSSTVGLLNPFRYKGYYYDTESGMYYCNSRYYVPEWGRWLNADNADYLQLEHCSCVNLFAYCDNNPVMQVDENGRLAISTLLAFGLAALIGAVTSAVSSIISQKMAGEKIKAKQVAVDAVFGAISGVVACTNIGLFGSIIVGAGMAGLQSLLEDEFNGEKPDIDKMRFSMVIGAFAGAIAGGGADVKNNVGRYNCMNGYIKAKHNSRHTNVLYEIKLAAIKDAYRINAVRYVSGVTFTLLVPLGIIKVFEEIIL